MNKSVFHRAWPGVQAFLFVVVTLVSWWLFASLADFVVRCAPWGRPVGRTDAGTVTTRERGSTISLLDHFRHCGCDCGSRRAKLLLLLSTSDQRKMTTAATV